MSLLATVLATVVPLSPQLDSDIFCLAENVYHEARGESLEGMLAVNSVVINRAISNRSEICEEVYKDFQFSWTLDDPILDLTSPSWDIALKTALYSLENHSEYDFSMGATHYFNPDKVEPEWANELTVTITIGNHTFLK
jgi:spore germination cell wall hydrolase CwlJ-like protein